MWITYCPFILNNTRRRLTGFTITRLSTHYTTSDMKTDPKATRPKTKKIKNSSDYREVFLTNTQASNRSHVYIDREIVDCIKRYLPIIAPGVSVSGYLSNIFKDHIQCHWNKIHELYINESVKPLKRM